MELDQLMVGASLYLTTSWLVLTWVC
ncbi:hypothetical protein OIU78_011443 [Salix suchowensis]|uniref:Uncharacterized protein n=1 Tax=Salix purpurea TaxID=77065 RepID=A0A9Q0PE25_SALPP|nr:hypothetical protein OIU78_011443 [Salix suchowensis]KAJ6686521.1 hypothetical protein OIU79_016322 [Salix purpurea]